MTIKNVTCTQCNQGIMTKPDPIHTYDFSNEGFLLQYCNHCYICNDIEEKQPDNQTIQTQFSNRFLKKLLKILCNRGRNFEYKTFNILYKNLKDKKIINPYDLTELILYECKELNIVFEWEYIIRIIYDKTGAYLNMDSYT